MPLITDYNAVKDIYQQASQLGVALPMFCCEDRETLEAVLASALKLGNELGIDDLPITPAWTCRYAHRPQLTFVAACGNPALGLELMFSDLECFMGDCSPYRKLRVMPHFDHAIPWLDADILDRYSPRFASVMFDASEKSFDENIRLTADYVTKFKNKVVIEAAVDEIFESGGDQQKNQPTTVEQAKTFLAKTGVDIIVPNVGTEHRATADQVVYRRDRAREISAAVGKILCLHGASSLKPADVATLPDDGFLKINIYTVLAVLGGQAVAQNIFDNLGNIFSLDQLKALVKNGVLNPAALDENYADTQLPIRPKLAAVANAPRRDAWFAAVRDRCCDFLKTFHYQNYKR